MHRNARAEQLYRRGRSLAQRADWAAATKILKKALEQAPRDLALWLELARAQRQQGLFEQATDSARQACTLDPQSTIAQRVLADCLQQQGQHLEAAQVMLPVADTASADIATCTQTAHTLLNAGAYEQAIEQFMAAVQIKSDHIPAHAGMATAFERLGLPAGASQCFRTAATLARNDGMLWASAIHQAMHACAWDTLADDTRALQQALQTNPAARPAPFVHIALPDATEAQHCASAQAAAHAVAQTVRFSLPALSRNPGKRKPGRIRLGYLSYDFRAHPMSRVIPQVFELHDRARFELFLYSIGPDDGSDARQRIARAADHWIDAYAMSDRTLAERIRADEIDILVDLMGHTNGSRLAVLCSRPAPIQVNYLGYPGTSGCAHIDYILADRIALPEHAAAHYTEHAAYLPDSYFPFDGSRTELATQQATQRATQRTAPSRADCALPATGFVFCSFNNHYKITPGLFDIWCRLLMQTPGSVLWLLEANAQSKANLIGAAQQRGVSAERLIFAPSVSHADHLARIGNANLVLDTQPYNAHTTGTDALWAGVPLVTCIGQSFAARVGASLLHAAGMPELICQTLRDYETLALQLANDSQRHAAVRAKLLAARAHAALFDTPRYTRNLERLYTQMFARWQAGHKPAQLDALLSQD